MSDELSTAYSPGEIEGRWYEHWEKSGYFNADAETDKEPWSLVIPPPNVTGALHMGTAFGQTHMDLYARRARLQGREVLFLPGTDHAGIATQNVVERELAKEGIDRQEIGRERFIERVWEWKEEYGGQIRNQIRRLGAMCDWERERFTMDEGLSRAVRTVFVRWFDDGLIYRGNRIINWCPFHTTALSDIELEHEDVAGELVTFRYALADGPGEIPVATTRVETMLGDSGVAVHPDDDRYKNMVGKDLVHPFFPDRKMMIVADDAVDPEFGTGAVKVTPAHDPNDFEIGERHGLEQVNILDESARVNDAGGRFKGLDRYEARQAVLHELQELGVVDNVERPYMHSVGHCYRCGTEIEPWLSEQWFVKMKPLAGPAMDVVRDGSVRIVPDRFAKQYLDWMENVRDWCISRQIWWGHRIPVWYCDNQHQFAALEDPTSCPECGSTNLTQDPDVLDTWFSSQLWPFSTLGWPDETPDLKAFYPTSLMVTGYEILYLWVARMIFSGLYFMEDIPFRDVLIHGIVRDKTGKKMSKSLGNVIDPLDLIENFGADALRFSLASSATSGNDVNFSEDRIEGARNFANKLWNAARFAIISLGDERPGLPDPQDLEVADRWILSRLNQTTRDYDRHLENYNLAEAMRTLHQFIWTEYCDWYIELAKMRLSTDRADAVKGVLAHVLDVTFRLLHPVMPFITEELWQKLRPEAGSIMLATWPAIPSRRVDERGSGSLPPTQNLTDAPDVDGVPAPESGLDRPVEEQMARFQDVVTQLRRIKVDRGFPQGRRVPAYIAAGRHRSEIEEMRDAIVALARLDSLEVVDSLPEEGLGARAITDAGIEVSLDLGGLIDHDAERQRLTARIDQMDAEVRRAEGKLANESFVAKAPPQVVEKERKKLDEARSAKEKLEAQLHALEG
jgi:valyl-tRNA synthetase